MATQFEFRLVDGPAPEGELDADALIALASSLKELATQLGRAETDAAPLGRPPIRTKRVARLTIGLAPGSTRVFVRRAEDEDALAFDLDEERAFDERFESIVSAIARDERPEWVTGTLAVAAGEFRAALAKAAPIVEFSVAGSLHARFETALTHKETWISEAAELSEAAVTFVGRLRMVNLDTHRLQVTDDVGTRVGLPNVSEPEHLGSLLGSYVAVVGTPERDGRGKLTQIHDASIARAEPPRTGSGVPAAVALDEILAGSPGPTPGGLSSLSQSEAEAFLQAIGR